MTVHFAEDELLPISALQHLVFCERQCALMFVEGQWRANRLTVEGRQLHERVHEERGEARGSVRIACGLSLRSLRLGLVGIADMVEFHRVDADESPGNAIELPGVSGLWRPVPVEYKRGRPKKEHCDDVQLCAQALCMEELWNVTIPFGMLYYGRTRRRKTVQFSAELRSLTERAAARLHVLVEENAIPKPEPGRWCRSCSLEDVCLPQTAQRRSALRYLAAKVREVLE